MNRYVLAMGPVLLLPAFDGARACSYGLSDPKVIDVPAADVGDSSRVTTVHGKKRTIITPVGEKTESLKFGLRCPSKRYIVEVPTNNAPNEGQVFSISIDPRIKADGFKCVDLTGVQKAVLRMNFKVTADGYSVSYYAPINAHGLGNCHTLKRH